MSRGTAFLYKIACARSEDSPESTLDLCLPQRESRDVQTDHAHAIL